MPGLTSYDPVVLSPDGTVLATVNGNGVVQLRDVATGQQIGGLMTAPIGISGAIGKDIVAFSPDGTTVAIVDGDGTVRLWNVPYLTYPLAQLCARIGGSITPAEWAEHVPAGPPYRNPCE